MLRALIGPLGVALQRMAADWLMVAAIWVMVLCATTLVAMGVIYGDAVALTGLHQSLVGQPGTATTVTVDLRAAPDEVERTSAAADRQMGRILGWTGGELITVARSESYALPDQPSSQTSELAVFGAYEAIERHATLSEGAWPTAGEEPMQAAVSSGVASRLGLSVGSEVELVSQRAPHRSLRVAVVGVWEPSDRADPFWRGEQLELDGLVEGASFSTHGPIVVAFEDMVGRASPSGVALSFRALPRLDRLAVDDVGPMAADVAALERRLGEELGERAFFQVRSGLASILEQVNRSLLVSRSGVVVLTIQLAVLAGYAILLVAGLLVEQRRVETALLQSRGAGVAHLAFISLLESLVIVLPAALAAPWLAVGLLQLLNLAGPLADARVAIAPQVDRAAILTAALAGVAAVVCLVVPTIGSGRGLAAVRQAQGRQGSRTLAQRIGLDLALVILAGVGLWQLRQYGAPITQTVRGTLGLDPLLVAAPAIGLAAGAILALRIVPLGAELAERVLARRSGLVGPLGARQLARRPLRYTRSALLLMLAGALGTFAGAYASTWTRSQADQAAYRTAADVRVEVSGFPDLPSWALGSAYRAVTGVESALPVALDAFDLEQAAGGTILGIDAERAASSVTLRPDLADTPIAELLGRLAPEAPSVAGLALEGEPTRLAVDIYAQLEPLAAGGGAPGFSAATRGILPAIVVRDADGVIHHVRLGRMTLGGGMRRGEIDLTAEGAEDVHVAPAIPLTVLAVELEIELPEGSQAVGTLRMDGVAVASGDGELRPLDTPPERFTASEASPINGFGAVRTTAIGFSVGEALDAPEAVPALAGETFLAQMGARVGDVVELGSLGERRAFDIVGSIRGFPTLEPAAPFIVVDLGTLAASDEVDGEVLEIDEWWLTTADGAESAVAEALRREPYSAAAVVAMTELHRALASDPIALGVIGALALGALAAVIFAAIGFMVSAAVSTRERLGEFALLQAIGLSHRQLSAWLWLENTFMLVVALAAGTGLGLLLAWVVLPFVALTQAGTVAVPPVEVVMPWGIYGVIYVVALGVLFVTVVVIGELLGRIRLSGVLRGGD